MMQYLREFFVGGIHNKNTDGFRLDLYAHFISYLHCRRLYI